MQKELKSGIVSIGTTETALSEVLLPVLDMFHKKFPDIRIRINNSTTPAAMNALKSGSVDFSVVTSPVEYDDEFEIVNIKKFQRCTRLRKRNGFFERKDNRHWRA